MKFLTDGVAKKYLEGRQIDPGMAVLEGEGAQQKIDEPNPHPRREEYGVWDRPASSAFEGEPTYYRLPMLKEPVWRWVIPVYFYVGGAAGASAMLASSMQVFAPRPLRHLIRRSRLAALGGIAASTALLIYDLGIRRRFLAMLRVFRPTSPMNMGSWILSTSGMLTTLALLDAGRNHSGLKMISHAAGIGSGLFGVVLAGYTGVLLNFSAVPVWQEAGRSLPLLFLASGISASSAFLQMLDLNRREERVVHAFGAVGVAAELAAAQAVDYEIRNFPHVRKTMKQGVPGRLWKIGKLLTLAGLILTLLPGRSRRKKIIVSALESTGALSMRFAIYKAGQVSARDPDSIIDLHKYRKQSVHAAQ